MIHIINIYCCKFNLYNLPHFCVDISFAFSITILTLLKRSYLGLLRSRPFSLWPVAPFCVEGWWVREVQQFTKLKRYSHTRHLYTFENIDRYFVWSFRHRTCPLQFSVIGPDYGHMRWAKDNGELTCPQNFNIMDLSNLNYAEIELRSHDYSFQSCTNASFV